MGNTWPCFDQNNQEWRKRHNQELEDLFKRADIVNEIKRTKSERARNVCKKQDCIVKRVPIKPKRQKASMQIVLEKILKKIISEDQRNKDWKEVAEDRDEWKSICCMARWS